MERTGEPGLGCCMGMQMRLASHGFLGSAAMTSGTVREALALAERFAATRVAVLASYGPRRSATRWR